MLDLDEEETEQRLQLVRVCCEATRTTLVARGREESDTPGSSGRDRARSAAGALASREESASLPPLFTSSGRGLQRDQRPPPKEALVTPRHLTHEALCPR